MATKRISSKLSGQSYSSLKQELDGIIDWFEGQKFDLDEAEAKYLRGVAIITELDRRLSVTKLKIEKVKIDVPD